MAFRAVLSLDELWRGELRAANVDGVKVVLIRLEEEVYALEDRCAHLGMPLHDGVLSGESLTCRHHLYRYDARTGAGIKPRAVCVRRFPVQVVEGRVFVDTTRSAT